VVFKIRLIYFKFKFLIFRDLFTKTKTGSEMGDGCVQCYCEGYEK